MLRPIQLSVKSGLAAAFGAFLLAVPAGAQAPELRMLDGLTKGGWTLRIRDDGANRAICVRSGEEFLQLQHAARGCKRVVLNDTPNAVTVQYTCPDDGYGRTTVRREGNNLVQVQTQGIKSGKPFSYSGEARHTGRC